MPANQPIEFASVTWKTEFLRLPSHGYDNLKKCHHCQKKASQWILFTAYGVWDARCHAHRIRAKQLPGARFVNRRELRVMQVMEL